MNLPQFLRKAARLPFPWPRLRDLMDAGDGEGGVPPLSRR